MLDRNNGFMGEVFILGKFYFEVQVNIFDRWFLINFVVFIFLVVQIDNISIFILVLVIGQSKDEDFIDVIKDINICFNLSYLNNLFIIGGVDFIR